MSQDFESSMLAFDLMLNAGSLFLYAGLYVLISLATRALFQKTDSDSWKAWVPFVREWEMFRLAGMSPMWAIILPLGGMLVTVIATVAFVAAIFFFIAEVTTTSSPDVMSLVGLGIGGFLLFFGVITAWYVFMLVVTIKMMNRINRGFNQSVALTLLGVFLYPVWLGVLGWGSARWQHGGRTSVLSFADGSFVPITSHSVVIGSHRTTDGLPAGVQLVTLHDTTGTVAPFHTQLDRKGDTWMVTDLHSPTGTFVIDGTGQLFQLTQPMVGITSFLVGQTRIDVRS